MEMLNCKDAISFSLLVLYMELRAVEALYCPSMWCRAVWKEGQKEVEAVIPDNWIRPPDLVFWPNGANAEKPLKNRQEPNSSWRTFPLIKIKCKSANRKTCEDWDTTTTVESSDDEDTMDKRKKKKKLFPDFVSGNSTGTESTNTCKQASKEEDLDSSSASIVSLPIPPKKIPPGGSTCEGTKQDRRSSGNDGLPQSQSRSKSKSPLTYRPGSVNDRLSHSKSRSPLTYRRSSEHDRIFQLRSKSRSLLTDKRTSGNDRLSKSLSKSKSPLTNRRSSGNDRLFQLRSKSRSPLTRRSV